MDIGEELFRLLISLKEHKRPRDDTLLSKLSSLLYEYFFCYGFDPNLTSKGIFNLEELKDVDPDILSFFLQMAGLSVNICEEEFKNIEGFIIEVMRTRPSNTSILCGWNEAMKCILSKHNKPISEEILNHIYDCLLDKRYFVNKTTLSLMDLLIENNIKNLDLRNVEFILSAVLLDFSKNICDVSGLQTILSLMEKIFLRNKSDSVIPPSWKLIFHNEIIETLKENIFKLPRDEMLGLLKILDLLCGMMECKRGCDEVLKIFERLIVMDEKIKVLHVAAWMMESPFFHHLRNNLEHLILSPLLHKANNPTSASEGFNFSNSSFDSSVLKLSFIIVSKQKLTRPDMAFDLCLTFLSNTCLKMKGKYDSKCIHACLDAMIFQASRLNEHPNANHRSCLVKLLLDLKEDHLTVSRIFKIIEAILVSYLPVNKMDGYNSNVENEDDDDDCSELFKALRQLIKSNTWDIRDSVVTFIGFIYQSQVSIDVFQRTIVYDLHRIIWDSLQDEEPYVRASAIDSLSVFINSSYQFRIQIEISQKSALAKVIEIMRNDEEAFPRRSSVNFVIDHIISNHQMLHPSFRNKNSTLMDENSEKVKHLVEVLAVSYSNDLDWEVKILILKFFGKLVLEILFQQMWSHHKNKKIKSEGDETEAIEDVHRVMHNTDAEVASLALRTIFEAKYEYDLSVKEVANTIVVSLHEKLKSMQGNDIDLSIRDLQDFVSCFCNGMDDIINQCIESSLITKDKKLDLASEICSVLDDIEACMVPCYKPQDEHWTSDDEEYLDFGMVDCY